MEKSEINNQVREKIDSWSVTHSKLFSRNITFTDRAVELLCTIIENIEKDSSLLWRDFLYDREILEMSQQKAIESLPIFFDMLVKQRGLNRFFSRKDTVITTWVILHSISRGLDMLCFIPKPRR